MDSLTIDGFELPVQRPESVAALCELVKAQRAKREAVYPVGGRTMLDFGLPPTKPGIAVDMTALNQVIDYPARDMTITVQAGITFAKMQEVLAKEGQWLPLDVPDPERMTIGGLIAANVSGPRRYGYGTLRDYVIGISFVTDDGVEVKGGGRVVKNVAGYDLMKLHIGALGTLGVITQVTLKVRPKPEANLLASIQLNVADISQAVEVIQKSQIRPVAVHLRIEDDRAMILIGLEEKAVSVEWQMSQLMQDIQTVPVSMFHIDANDTPAIEWQRLTADQIDSRYSYIRKLSTKPSNTVNVIRNELKVDVAAELINGIIWTVGDAEFTTPASCECFTLRAPTAWKTPERIFGKPTPAFELMRHIKRTLDRDNVFNPDRMFA